ncbi:MAG: hypothetical protein KGH62_03610, partial [Candidatus Micrarchaeota archaeon]|nr:hypothetical protein [Candidatus Micrarchaeota archaeon]
DEKILAVFGRSGWGTGWQVQNLAKAWLVTKYDAGDDPEIYFNNITIEALNIGRVLGQEGIDLQEFKSLLEELPSELRRVTSGQKERFGTLNGIEYVARIIADDLIS